MNKKIISFLFLIGLIIAGCSTRDYFGEFSDKEMLIFQLEGQSASTLIKGDTIYVKVSDNALITSLSATSIKISDYATVSPAVGEKQDFSHPVAYTVKAEDGSTRVYYVVVESGDGSGGANKPQIPNSNFDLWHTATHSNYEYEEIGENNDDTTWGTGNQGAIIALSGDKSKLPSQPQIVDADNFAAELTTTNMGFFGSIAGKGVAAGNIFTGRFDIGNTVNARPVFGIPYTEMPKAFKVDYKYSPAKGLIDGKRKPVAGEDAMDMYLILEKREGDEVKRLGVAWFRSGATQENWKTQEVEIKYASNGKAPNGVEEYAKQVLKYGHDGDTSATNPSNMPETTWGDAATDTPTHIIVVFTSSYLGDYFIGAPGSKLIVDNFELIY